MFCRKAKTRRALLQILSGFTDLAASIEEGGVDYQFDTSNFCFSRATGAPLYFYYIVSRLTHVYYYYQGPEDVSRVPLDETSSSR